MVEGDKYDYTKPSMLEERDGLIGTVKFFDQSRSFGFVTLSPEAGGGDVFLHLKEIAGGKVLSIPVTRNISKSENEFRRGCISSQNPKPLNFARTSRVACPFHGTSVLNTLCFSRPIAILLYSPVFPRVRRRPGWVRRWSSTQSFAVTRKMLSERLMSRPSGSASAGRSSG